MTTSHGMGPLGFTGLLGLCRGLMRRGFRQPASFHAHLCPCWVSSTCMDIACTPSPKVSTDFGVRVLRRIWGGLPSQSFGPPQLHALA